MHEELFLVDVVEGRRLGSARASEVDCIGEEGGASEETAETPRGEGSEMHVHSFVGGDCCPSWNEM